MVSSRVSLIFSLVAFAVIHSFLASLPFKRFFMRFLGPSADKLFMPAFSLIAVITISPVVYFLLKKPGKILYIVPSPWRWLMVGAQLLTSLVAPLALMDAPHRFRIRKQLAGPGTPEAGHLDIRGIYRWIRDPFLLSGLIFMLMTPFMTTNLLVIYILTGIYLYLGSLHWESRLVAQFGNEYKEYRKHVRRIIPRLTGYQAKKENMES